MARTDLECGLIGELWIEQRALCNRADVIRSRSEAPTLKQDDTPVTQMWELGSFAEQILVHKHAVVKVDDDMPFEQVALIGCGVTTGLGAALNTAKI